MCDGQETAKELKLGIEIGVQGDRRFYSKRILLRAVTRFGSMRSCAYVGVHYHY